jgi:endonuclease I
MKQQRLRFRLLTFLTIAMLLTMIAPAMAAEPALQHNYSSEANSGIRHEVCTTLAGTTVGTYYTGNYSFDKLATQSGDTLLKSLRTLMSTTHTYQTSYDECRDLSVKTDCENADGVTINLLYSSYISNRGEYINDTKKGWNREHVWPKSLGGFNTSGAGADLHHIRPTDSSLNGTRGNDFYGYATGSVKEMYGTVVTGGAHGGKKGGGYMEPLDNVKGDVARICLYVYVRYGGELSKCSSITNVFQSVDVLLEWCALDPVDTWEMGRNEVVYAIQGNRNVFIDYPELAWSLFSEEIPEDLVTPSGNTDIQPACSHKNVEYRNAVESSCTVNGYSGDAYCADCGIFLSEGTYSPSTGVHTFGPWANVEGAPNLQSRSCKECGFDDARTIQTAQPDASNQQIWVVVAVVAALLVLGGTAAVIVVVFKKKQ